MLYNIDKENYTYTHRPKEYYKKMLTGKNISRRKPSLMSIKKYL